MNCNLTQCFTACVYVLKCLVDPDIPLNEGFYRPIEVVAPEGSAVNVPTPSRRGRRVGSRDAALATSCSGLSRIPCPTAFPRERKG